MSGLIDKMDTITAINDYYDMAKYKGAEFTEKELLNAIIGIITSQPTAYDVEAVVRKLEELAKLHARHQLKCEEKGMDCCADRHEHKVQALDEAIAIVKRGGRNEG